MMKLKRLQRLKIKEVSSFLAWRKTGERERKIDKINTSFHGQLWGVHV